MRPLLLELAGFKSYDRAEVDWEPYDLVVISGDTGAGKTSLLDAIAFALYGRTPEVRDAKDLLTLGHTHGEVRLTFALGGDTWRVTRRYGPDAPAPARLLERRAGEGWDSWDDDVDGRVLRLVGISFDTFTSAVLLAQGRFAQFLGAAPKARDDILRELFAVVPLDGVRKEAEARRDALTARAQAWDDAADMTGGQRPAAWWAAARRARAAAARCADLAALASPSRAVDDARARADAAAARAHAVTRAAALLPDEAGVEALRQRLGRAAAARDEAQRVLDAAQARAEAAVSERDEARRAHGGDAATLAALSAQARRVAEVQEELPGREAQLTRERARAESEQTGLRAMQADGVALADRHRALAERMAAFDALDEARAKEDAARSALDAARAAVASAAAEADASTRRRAEAQRATEEAAREHAAHAVLQGLSRGDECPVCGGTVGDHAPPAPSGTDPLRLQGLLDEARGEERRTGNARVKAATLLETAETELASRTAAVRAAEAALIPAGDAPDELRLDPEATAEAARAAAASLEHAREDFAARTAALASTTGRLDAESKRLQTDLARLADDRRALGEWAEKDDPAAALEEAHTGVGTAERLASDALDAAAAAVRAGSVAAARWDELARREVDALRLNALRAAEGAGVDPGDVAQADATRLLDGVGDLARRITHAGDRTRAAADAASAKYEATLSAFRDAASPAGVNDPGDLPGASRDAAVTRTEARAELTRIADGAATAAALRRQASGARREAALFHQVALDLRANNFPRFLLGRFRERLATGASMRLQELSLGAYRFAGTGADPLAVVDLRRGEQTRAAATLSGGERFLASLALALGLSDIAAESGGRLDCLFLDEGFSTLDADSLEQALAGVERLSGDGRLVAVITHLPGVAERLGASLIVRKDARGVSRIAEEAETMEALPL